MHGLYTKKLFYIGGYTMSKKFFSVMALLLLVTMSLTSCGLFGNVFGKTTELTDTALNAEKFIDFKDGANREVLFESDGWSNGDVFNVVWKQHNVYYGDGIMRLGITEEKATAYLNDAEVEFDYTAGEARTHNYYHYGDYEVSMKPSANGGTASTFFVCTGPYDTKYVLDENGDYVLDENGQRLTQNNPHDEIDIEFLGKDTTKVQFNFFVDGQGGNEYMYDLGFDASEEFHTYGFRWEVDAITWFVDGKPVYKVTTDKTVKEYKNLQHVDKLPSTAGRILTNYWCGNSRAWGWMGKFNGQTQDQGTEYQWMATSAVGAPLNPPEKPPVEVEGINWAEIDAVAPGFASAEKYVVETSGNQANITYEGVGGSDYKPVEMDISALGQANNFVYLKVTNNGSSQVSVRVNVIDQALMEAGAQNQSVNISATQDGVVVNTDLVWGGSFFSLEPGQTAELVVKFSPVAEKLQLMLDSSRNDSNLYAGNVTVEEIKFAADGEITPPPPACEHTDADENAICDNCGESLQVPPSPPEHPVSGNLNATVNGETVTIQGNVTDGYGVNVDEGNAIIVVYNNIAGNSYKNFWANVSAIAGTKNIFSVTVTNNGTAAVKIRIDMESQTQINENTTACNLSATQDGNEAYTDLTWGGSTFTVEAGATSTLVVVYDASKKPTNVKFFVDSSQWDDDTAHEGAITLTNMEFSGEYIPEGGDPVDPPAPPVEPTLNFSAEAGTGYEINGLNIKYNGPGNTWKPVTAPIAELAGNKNTFTVTITNNGTANTRVRFDIQGTVWVSTGEGSGTDACNQSAVGGDVWTDLTWGGSTLTVPAGQSVTLTITYDDEGPQGAVTKLLVFVDSARNEEGPYSADITLSGISFEKVGGEDPVDPPAPPAPVEGEYVKFEGNDCYTLHNEQEYVNSIRVTYSDVSNNTWQNVNTWIGDKAQGKTALSVTIQNNGTETVLINVKLEDGSSNALAEKKLEIAAGETVTVNTDFAGEAAMLFFFIDSDWAEVPTSHAGDITISGILFSGEVGGNDPVDPPAPPAPVEGEYVKFNGDDCYTLHNEQEYVNSIRVTYSDVSNNTWRNVNTWIGDKAQGKTALSVTIQNNGTETVLINVKLEDGSSNALAEKKLEIAAGETVTVNTDFAGEAAMLFFFIDSDWAEIPTSHAGDITISGILFE